MFVFRVYGYGLGFLKFMVYENGLGSNLIKFKE